MPQIGSHADVLRALGRALDDAGAAEIELANHETFMTVRWRTANRAPGERILQENELEVLRAEAQTLRGGASRANPSTSSFAERLRTLGQELDQEGVEVTSIVQDDASFTVSGLSGRRYYRRQFFIRELEALSAARRARRGGATPEATSYAERFRRLLEQQR